MAYPGAASSHVDGPGFCEGNGRWTEGRAGVVCLEMGSAIQKDVGTGDEDFEV